MGEPVYISARAHAAIAVVDVAAIRKAGILLKNALEVCVSQSAP